ncbi:MAG: hypothetical protein HWD61_09420 [Parachlamydiaceae bacterium]|nr:MAG: hypothetical protein HWD61_09420 [Parachlamydiaceae bacterium]
MGNDQKVEVKSEEKLDEDLISKEQNAETQIPELKESIETVNPLPLNQAEKDSDQIEPKDSEQKKIPIF